MFFALPPADPGLPEEGIVITASRDEVTIEETSDAIARINRITLERLDPPLLVSALRLLPSTSLAQAGPAGMQAQLRIRGAEANHSLLFIDGIKANDPAAGNEARFELLGQATSDAIELLRGAQSSLWGAEAIGGVVALRSIASDAGRFTSSAEFGSEAFVRLSSRAATRGAQGQLVAALDYQRSDGSDSVGDGEEKDGYDLLTARLAADVALGPHVTLEASGFAIDGLSAFDGFDPVTFLRANTDDETENRLAAARFGVLLEKVGADRTRLAVTYLDSRNVNFANGAQTNRTAADRLALSASLGEDIGALKLIGALDHEAERFTADDTAFGGFTRQDVTRDRNGMLLEARWSIQRLHVDAALRHDRFEGSENATSLSAGVRYALTDRLSLAVNYGEGIAQPSFYDLYGFFPGNFRGNPHLRPERASGGDFSLRYDGAGIFAAASVFTQNLKDEIVATYDPATFLSSATNADGQSQRWGVEIEGGWHPSAALSLSANYSFLDAEEPSGDEVVNETRRPRHRGALYATGALGRLTYGGSLAIVGARDDVDFDLWPASRVRLDAYALLSARLGWSLSDRLELSLRGSNLLDSDYQDVVGYNTQGRAIFAGFRITA